MNGLESRGRVESGRERERVAWLFANRLAKGEKVCHLCLHMNSRVSSAQPPTQGTQLSASGAALVVGASTLCRGEGPDAVVDGPTHQGDHVHTRRS